MRKEKSVSKEGSNELFDSAILDAVLSVPGVVEVTQCTTTKLAAEASSKETSQRDLELGVAVEYGSSIPTILESIQRKLKEEVRSAIGLEVKKLDLCIQDIRQMPCE